MKRHQKVAIGSWVLWTLLVVVVLWYIWPGQPSKLEVLSLGEGPLLESVPEGARYLNPMEFHNLRDKPEAKSLGLVVIGAGLQAIHYVEFVQMGDNIYCRDNNRSISLGATFRSYNISSFKVRTEGAEVQARLTLQQQKEALGYVFLAIGALYVLGSAVCVSIYRSGF